MSYGSMLWDTNGIGDGRITGYNDIEAQELFRMLVLPNNKRYGIFPVNTGFGSQAQCSVAVPANNTVSVGTGSGFINGIFFKITVGETLNIPSSPQDSNQSDVFFVCLTADWETQTVFLESVKNTRNGASLPVPTQDYRSKWQLPIAVGFITKTGVISQFRGLDYTVSTSPVRFSGISDNRYFNGVPMYNIPFTGMDIDVTGNVMTITNLPRYYSWELSMAVDPDGTDAFTSITGIFDDDSGAQYRYNAVRVTPPFPIVATTATASAGTSFSMPVTSIGDGQATYYAPQIFKVQVVNRLSKRTFRQGVKMAYLSSGNQSFLSGSYQRVVALPQRQVISKMQFTFVGASNVNISALTPVIYCGERSMAFAQT